ncbi:MAG: ATP-binding protein [Planctomycetes bacterium]|nr:ATP-binding protein [Planctomycetota bacterium]
MNPMPELSPMLKQLRLSGILDSLEVRNHQAIEEKLAYTEFLALLLQDETARRTNKKLSQRLRKAGFQSNKTLEAFDFTFNPIIDKKLIMDLATGQFMSEKVPVLIAGPCGTGKSHLAQAIGHCAVRIEKDVLFTSQTKMLGQLHASKAALSYERKLKAFIKVDLLIIDDFGLKPLQPPQDEDLHAVVAERYEKKSTIVTSNLDFDEWGDAFPNKILAAATLDRLRHGAYRVVLNGKSYREPKPLTNTLP